MSWKVHRTPDGPYGLTACPIKLVFLIKSVIWKNFGETPEFYGLDWVSAVYYHIKEFALHFAVMMFNPGERA